MPALKRPDELHWTWRKPPEPFPQTPGCNGCFLAPSSGGKSTTLISMILGPYSKVFDELHVFSPSVEVDSAWLPVREFARRLERSTFESEWNEPVLRQILDDQHDKIRS